MKGIERYQALIEEIDLVVADRRQWRAAGPHFVVKHGRHQPGTSCLPGETLDAIVFWHSDREFPIQTQFAPLLVLDCLCRSRHTHLSTGAIAKILNCNPLYIGFRLKQPRVEGPDHFDARSVKRHIRTLQSRLTPLLEESGFPPTGGRIIESNTSESNMPVYQLKATAEYMHLVR